MEIFGDNYNLKNIGLWMKTVAVVVTINYVYTYSGNGGLMALLHFSV